PRAVLLPHHQAVDVGGAGHLGGQAVGGVVAHHDAGGSGSLRVGGLDGEGAAAAVGVGEAAADGARVGEGRARVGGGVAVTLVGVLGDDDLGGDAALAEGRTEGGRGGVGARAR